MAAKHNNIGLKAEPPAQSCSDEKCPWHGHLKLRGRVFEGRVRSAKAAKTAIVEWDYLMFLPKYERYERRHSRLVAYNPLCVAAAEGDMVKIAECRPIGKTKSFVVIEKFAGEKK